MSELLHLSILHLLPRENVDFSDLHFCILRCLKVIKMVFKSMLHKRLQILKYENEDKC